MLGLGEIIAFLVGGAIPIVAYFGRRWIEKRGPTERMERTTKLLDIHERMQRTGLSLDQLRSLEQELSGRTLAQLSAEKTMRVRVIEDRQMEESHNESITTQADMNSYAELAYARADDNLREVIREAEKVFPEKWSSSLTRGQEAWDLYRDRQAELVSLRFEGGSIRPMIRASELERLTLVRIAELKDLIDQHRRDSR